MTRSTAGEGSASIGARGPARTLPAFVLAVLLISASPGPAMALIFRRAARRGPAGAVPTVLGLEAGLYVWALFAGAGIAALVAASEPEGRRLRDRVLSAVRAGRRPGVPDHGGAGSVLVGLGLRVAASGR